MGYLTYMYVCRHTRVGVKDVTLTLISFLILQPVFYSSVYIFVHFLFEYTDTFLWRSLPNANNFSSLWNNFVSHFSLCTNQLSYAHTHKFGWLAAGSIIRWAFLFFLENYVVMQSRNQTISRSFLCALCAIIMWFKLF